MPRKNKKLARTILSKKVLLSVFSVAAIVLIYFVFLKSPGPNPSSESASSATTQAASQIKSVPVDKNSKTSSSVSTQSTPSSSKKSVTPIITSADQTKGQLTIRAYVNGVLEDTGTCTAELTSSSHPAVTKSGSSLENVSYTSCSPITVDSSLLGSGSSWKLVVKYNSADAAGSSASQTITIE